MRMFRSQLIPTASKTRWFTAGAKNFREPTQSRFRDDPLSTRERTTWFAASLAGSVNLPDSRHSSTPPAGKSQKLPIHPSNSGDRVHPKPPTCSCRRQNPCAGMERWANQLTEETPLRTPNRTVAPALVAGTRPAATIRLC